jgi:hypothetical protein
MHFQVLVNGVDYTDYVALNDRGLQIRERLNSGNSANIRLRADYTVPPFPIVTGHVARIYINRELVFEGTIGDFTPSVKRVRTTMVREYYLPVYDHNYIANRRIYTNAFMEALSGDIVKDIVGSTLFTDGVTYTHQSVDPGRLITEASFNMKRVADVMDTLAKENGFYWYIDNNKILWFKPIDLTNPAPFVITDDADDMADSGNLVQNSLRINMPRTQYRNRLYVKGFGTTVIRNDFFEYDGTNNNFTLEFEAFDIIQITANGIARSFEVDSSQAQSEFMWKFGEIQVRMNRNVELTEGDLVVITYRGRYPLFVSSEDAVEIADRAAIEKNSGIYESVDEVKDIYGFARLQDYADSKLATVSRIPTVANYKTFRWGVHPGMLQQISSMEDAYNMSKQFVIEDVDIGFTDVGEIEVSVRGTAGTTVERWYEWFKNVKMSADSGVLTGGGVTLGIKTQDTIKITEGVSVALLDQNNRWDIGKWDEVNWG